MGNRRKASFAMHRKRLIKRGKITNLTKIEKVHYD